MYVTPGRLTSWQAEQTSEGSWLPSVRSTLLLFAVLALVLLTLGAGGPEAAAQGSEREPSLCEQHAGRPGWAGVCEP